MWPWKEKIQPKTVKKNALGETLLEVPARDLVGSTCLRGKDLSHAVLRGMARERHPLWCRLAYARVEQASFRQADLEGADLLYTDIKRARFDGAMIGPTATIPGVYAGARREW
jgi:uncharacterized protein YjbI with pentapeptide repeats